MNPSLALTEAEITQVRAILSAHLPPGIKVSVFGSRAKGKPKPWSDLDLALEGRAPLPLELVAELAESFDESDLPWKVDLVDYKLAAPGFRSIIDAEKVSLFGF